MYRDHAVGIVVPAYNEAGHVGDVLRSVPDFVDRIYVIDDRSTDDTWEEIHRAADGLDASGRSIAAGDGARGGDGTGRLQLLHRSDPAATTDTSERQWNTPPSNDVNDVDRWSALLAARTAEIRPGERVVRIQHAENRGAGGAIKTGYIVSLVDGVDVVATIDGDGQMDPGQLPRFLDPIVAGEADYTKGNRFAPEASLTEMPVFRLVGNAMLTALTRIASGYWSVSDPQNGYTAIRTEALARVGIDDLFEYYGYCNELLVRLKVAGATVRDVPQTATYDDEQSHIDYSTYIPKVSAMLLRNFLWRLVVTYLDPDGASTGPPARRYQTEPPVEADGGGSTVQARNQAPVDRSTSRRSSPRSAGEG